MKVVLLKDLTIGKQGDVLNLSAPMANYLIRCKAVKEFKQRGRKKTKANEDEEEEEVNDD